MSSDLPLIPAVVDGKAVYARYTPQAWIGDQCIEITHDSPEDLHWPVAADTWNDITDGQRDTIEQQLRAHAAGDAFDMPGGDYWADEAANAPEATEWVRGRGGYGPFEVHFHLHDTAPTDTTDQGQQSTVSDGTVNTDTGYYRTLVTVEVLSTEPLTGRADLEDLYQLCQDGPWSGQVTTSERTTLNKDEMVLRLGVHGRTAHHLGIGCDDNCEALHE